MQLTAVEYAQNVIGLEHAGSTEHHEDLTHKIIDLHPDRREVTGFGGTLRLGLYESELKAGTRIAEIYGNKESI